MNVESQKKQHYSSLETSGIAYWTIRLIHDNPLLPLVRNPYKLLRAAGLDQTQRIVEVGCGPGFFTVPAADMVGNQGHVYAIDINRRAIERVRRKIQKQRLENVTPLCINASKTGLSAGSCDLAFVFGLRHIAGGLEKVLLELYRILRPGGTLSLEKTKGSETALRGAAKNAGFDFSEKHGRIFRFKKRELS